MAKLSFGEKRKILTLNRFEKIMDELPFFLNDYFLSLENDTSHLTRLNYAMDIQIFLDFASMRYDIPVKDMKISILDTVTATDIERFLSYLSSFDYKGKHHTCNEKAKARKLAAIRSMYKYYFNKDKIIANVAAKVATPKIHEKEIIRLENDEIAELIDSAETGKGFSGRQLQYSRNTSVRDVALLTLFLGTGIRISELVGLDIDDIFFENNSFIVTRKGGNRTILYFTDEVAFELKRWLEYRAAIKLPPDEKALFVSLQNKRISVRAVENLVKKYAKTVTPLKKITPHKLRSTFGTKLYRETGDIYVVADFLGHKDINTTKKHYAAISDDIRRNAINKIVLKPDDDGGEN